LVRIRFLLVARLGLNRPVLDFPQMWVNKELEGSRLGDSASGSIVGRKAPELDQPRLPRRQLQRKLRKPLAKIGEEPLGVLTMLEARPRSHRRSAR
jgi:hypothetical protein